MEKSKIKKALLDIYIDLNKIKSTSISLLAGDGGIQLFNYLYLEMRQNFDEQIIQNNIQLLAENSLASSYPTFCSGFVGTNWFFKFLSARNVISHEDKIILCYRDKTLKDISLQMLQNGNYDFLHGAIGIAYYMLYAHYSTSNAYYKQFFIFLNSLFDKSTHRDMIPGYDFKISNITPSEINLGLSHGIPSILKFCIQCYQKNICIDESIKLSNKIMDYLLTYGKLSENGNYFPYSISTENGTNTSGKTRLAWCYGDLGIGIILYQAGITFRNKKIIEFSLNVLLHSTKRKTFEETNIKDASLCHGTAGVAHIYNRMWHYTKNNSFKDACEYWIKKTLDLGVYNDGIGGYKKYNNEKQIYEADCSLLEGATGVGLAFFSYLTDDFSWDYCLMLND